MALHLPIEFLKPTLFCFVDALKQVELKLNFIIRLLHWWCYSFSSPYLHSHKLIAEIDSNSGLDLEKNFRIVEMF